MRHRSLKTAFRLLVAEVGGLEAAASLTRVGKSEIARYYDPNHASFAPADVVADLEAAAPLPLVTRVLAHLAGHRLAAVEAPGAAEAQPLIQALAATLHPSGAFAMAFAAAMADQQLTPCEVPAIREALTTLLHHGEAALALCHPPAASPGESC